MISPPLSKPLAGALALLALATVTCRADVSAAREALVLDRPADAVRALADPAKHGDADALFALAVLHDLGAGAPLAHDEADRLLRLAVDAGYRPAAEYLAWKRRVGFGAKPAPEEAALLAQRAAAMQDSTPVLPAAWLARRGDDFEPGFKRAFVWMLEAADAGSAVAMGNLAEAFLAPTWTQPDLAAHVHWLKAAAEAGHAASLERMSLYHRVGLLGLREDATKARDYLRRAAEVGAASAQYQLAEQLARTNADAPADAAAAVHWYRLAADQGHVEAMIELGRRYRDGEGAVRDDAAAVACFEKAATANDPTAIGDLGWMYAHGRGVARDPARAAELYRRAGDGGNGWAATELGRLHKIGAFGPADFEAARVAFMRAAELGHTAGMCDLGALYFDGLGVKQDRAEAFLWYERAAREGNGWAQNRVGWMLHNGHGVERDDEEALQWFELAATKGEAAALGNLGYFHARGIVVPRDPAQAFAKLTEALKRSRESFFGAELTRLFRNMSLEELQQMAPAVRTLARPTAGVPPPSLLAEWLADTLLDGSPALRDLEQGMAWLEHCAAENADWALLALSERLFLGRQQPFDSDRAQALLRRLRDPSRWAALRLAFAIDMACGDEDVRRIRLEDLKRRADADDEVAARVLLEAYLQGSLLSPDVELAGHYLEQVSRLHAARNVASNELLRTLSSQLDDLTKQSSAKKQEDLDATVEREFATAEEGAPPRPVHTANPVYPETLKQHGIPGFATLEFVVDISGRPTSVRTKSATHPLFARAAEVALSQWRFVPAKKDGRATDTSMIQPFKFSLSE